jgi:Phage ABA sandwich domain
MDAQIGNDILAALEVIEKLKETHDIEINAAGEGWHVVIKNTDPLVTADGPSLLDCICRAALAAKEKTCP